MTESADSNRKSPVKEWLTKIKESKEPSLARECCIYKVPKYIREINADAYTPKAISIGPLHHDKTELADMENKKKIYVKNFLDRLPAEKKAEKEEEIITFVQNTEQLIRASYAETIKLEGSEFVKMIISDALFIIEHFINTPEGDSWLGVPVVVYAINLDLLLFENQLPFFVLDEIYNLGGLGPRGPFLALSIRFIKSVFDFDFNAPPEGPKHLTDLVRTSLVQNCRKGGRKGPIRDLPRAQELRKSGINFKAAMASEGWLSVRFQERRRLIPYLKVRELCIPRFTVHNGTEILLRNVMALEQCLYTTDTMVCNYVRLMNCLMKTNKDVELLVAAGIISLAYGEDTEVANMFNKLGSQIILDEKSCYHGMCEKLKETCERRWNRTKATWWRVITDPVGGIATAIALLGLVLTFIQTICSLRQCT